VGLFDDDTSGLEASFETDESESSSGASVRLSNLSQTGKAKASELISSIENNSEKMVSLQRLCPNWKENLAFTMMQKDGDEVRAALEKVRLKRKQMLAYKRRIVEAWESQDVVLDVFEKGLSSSLGCSDVS
jgi:hypothetical protein